MKNGTHEALQVNFRRVVFFVIKIEKRMNYYGSVNGKGCHGSAKKQYGGYYLCAI